MKNSNNILNPSASDDSLQTNTIEKTPANISPSDNLNAINTTTKVDQNDSENLENRTIFGDWQINCKTIDF
jgi:hypothetical protein